MVVDAVVLNLEYLVVEQVGGEEATMKETRRSRWGG